MCHTISQVDIHYAIFVMSNLTKKKAAFTIGLILDSATELLDVMEVSELSFKKVSEHADISERTMFRHFTTRQTFLEALTQKLYNELALPQVPESSSELEAYIAILYEKFEANPRKVLVLHSSDLFPIVLSTATKRRLTSLERLLQKDHPACSPDNIKKTAANLCYTISASSWRYYRMHFNFDAKMAIECAQMLVKQSLWSLKNKT